MNGNFKIAYSACLNHWKNQKKEDVDRRNPADNACRVAAILLLPEFRESVAIMKIMSKKKARTMMDQAVWPVSAFYEVAAEKFRDASL